MELLKAAGMFLGSGYVAVAALIVSALAIWMPAVAALVPPVGGPYVKGLFFLSAAASLVHVLRFLTSPIRRRQKERATLDTISGLSAEAKGLLNLFLQEDVLRIDARDATVGLLNRFGFIYRPSVSQAFYVFDFTLAPYVRKLLTKHPEALEGAARSIGIEVYSRDVNPMHQIADNMLRRPRGY